MSQSRGVEDETSSVPTTFFQDLLSPPRRTADERHGVNVSLGLHK